MIFKLKKFQLNKFEKKNEIYLRLVEIDTIEIESLVLVLKSIEREEEVSQLIS